MLKGGHLILPKQGRLRPAPKIPEEIRSIKLSVRIQFFVHKVSFNTLLLTVIH